MNVLDDGTAIVVRGASLGRTHGRANGQRWREQVLGVHDNVESQGERKPESLAMKSG